MEIQTEMTINRAVKHLSWRLQQPKLIPNDKDIEAFNFILSSLEFKYETALIEDDLLIKLLIERLLLLTIHGKRSMADAIEVIKETLRKSVSSWLTIFREEVPLIRFSRALEQDFIKLSLSDDDLKDSKLVIKAKNKLMTNNQKKYAEKLTTPYTEAELQSFIAQLLFDLRTEFQNKP